jgi:transcriptional regulator with GAF, ATPase, and Fis domain
MFEEQNGTGLNADQTLRQINEFNDSLNQTTQQLNELQAIWERTLQALNKRGIQIQIDFARMLTGVRQQLERSQTLSNLSARRLMQFQELITTSALLTSSLEFEQVMEKVLDSVIKLTGAERVYLMLKHGDDPELKVQIARNAQRHTLSTEDVTFSRGIIQTVIEARAPLITTNAQSDERFSGMQSVIVNELRSIIIVPMFLKEQLIGVLYADNRIEQGVFNQEMTSILAAFANQAAIAISNARLFEKISAELRAAQNQVKALLDQIDYDKVQNKVVEITSSEYFQSIATRAKEMRKRNDKPATDQG